MLAWCSLTSSCLLVRFSRMLVFELMCLVCTSIDDEVAEAYLVTVMLALQEAFSRQI